MTVLVLAPHADDETLGMGGTIARLRAQGTRVVVAVLTGHGPDPHPIWPRSHWDTIRTEAATAMAALGGAELVFRDLPAACLDAEPAWSTNGVIDALIRDYAPQTLYVPFAFDLHKDHGAVAYGASVATRPYLAANAGLERVLAYETLTETHLAPPHLFPAFQPNVFVDIAATLEAKLAAMAAYESQIQPDHQPRSLAALRALARTRGAHIGSTAAEAFVLLGEYQR